MKGPTISVSRDMYAMKYLQEGETFEQGMKRVAKALRDDAPHERAFRDILMDMRFLPGGRVQAAMGADKDVTPYNCLSGDTKILTREYGSVPIREVAGQTVTLLDGDNNWTKCTVYDHGEQTTYVVTFTGGFNSVDIRSTLEHGWVCGDTVVKTKSFNNKKGKRKISGLTPGRVVTNNEQYRKGVEHGIIYGDGSTQDGHYYVRLCGDKEELAHFLKPDNITYPQSYAGEACYLYHKTSSHPAFKELFIPDDLDYLTGFFHGWFATDGCVSTQPEATLCCDENEELWIRRWAPLIGWQPADITVLPSETNYGTRNKSSRNARFRGAWMTCGDFLRKKHKERWAEKTKRGTDWRAQGQYHSPRVERVYCPVVPTTHSFALACGIHSSNCFVAGGIEDSFVEGTGSIMARATEAAQTMRLGGGIGYDFSGLRQKGALIKSLNSHSSGPISFMHIFDAICKTVASSGHRRGAQMGVLRCDHPDIFEFVNAKTNTTNLTAFNISVAITHKFMECLASGKPFPLVFAGKTIKEIDAAELWETIMRNTWDWADPGVLFIDTINDMNNLWYCETITATNPCFTGDTRVWTAEGHKTFKELADAGDDVPVLTQRDDGRLVYRTMRNPRVTKRNASLVKVTFDDGTSIRCTPNHKFYHRDGSATEAQDLSVGQSVQSVYRWNANQKGYKRLGNALSNLMEHHVGFESLTVDQHVHHKNNVKHDNRPSNLEAIDASEHNAMHMRGDLNPVRRFPDKNWLVKQDHSGENNGRWRDDVNTDTLTEMRKAGMSYAAIATASGCSKYTVMKRLGWNHKVVSVEHLIEVEDVYCGTVDDTHKFFVTLGNDDGVLVSNCGEQPLPPHGACLLGSFNLTKYITKSKSFDTAQLIADIPHVVRAMDNVVDRAEYPLPQQGREARAKRRMGLGVTGLANVCEIMGFPYGSPAFVKMEEKILSVIRDECYRASARLAAEKGAFALYNEERYLDGKFIKTLPNNVRAEIEAHGIRNSHLTSVAPTGTISLCADNISSGIEPVFNLAYSRQIQTPNGPITEVVKDYAYNFHGVEGRTTDDVTVDEHLAVLIAAQKHVDSAVSKTCNVGSNVSFEEFKTIYTRAYEGGAKGCTTFRKDGKRMGIFSAVEEKEEEKPLACSYDPATGTRSCE